MNTKAQTCSGLKRTRVSFPVIFWHRSFQSMHDNKPSMLFTDPSLENTCTSRPSQVLITSNINRKRACLFVFNELSITETAALLGSSHSREFHRRKVRGWRPRRTESMQILDPLYFTSTAEQKSTLQQQKTTPGSSPVCESRTCSSNSIPCAFNWAEKFERF